MQQNDAAPLRWPVRGFGGHQDPRPPPTLGQRHGVVSGLPKANGPPQAQCFASLSQEQLPVGGFQRSPPPSQPHQADMAQQQGNQAQRSSEEPDHEGYDQPSAAEPGG